MKSPKKLVHDMISDDLFIGFAKTTNDDDSKKKHIGIHVGKTRPE